MRSIIYMLLLVCAAWGGVLLKQVPDVLMLSSRDWSIEMPMWLAIIAVLLSIGFILTVWRLIHELFASIANSKSFFVASKQKTARLRTTQALLQLAQAQWEMAEKNAIKGAVYSDLPFINYISAAKAAQEQNAWERRDKYLALAIQHVPDSKIATGVIKAKLQYKQGDFVKSLDTLQALKNVAPKHPLVLRLLGEIYEKNKDWSKLLQLLPAIKKYKSCPKYILEELTDKAYQGLLVDTMHKGGKQELVKFWQDIPRDTKQNTRIIEAYVSCLCKLNEHKEAFVVLRGALKKVWDTKLIKLYGLIQGADLSKQIFLAEGWLRDHPGDPVLLLTLARLCLRHQLWGKAKDYLEMSIQLEPNPEAYAELGRLFGNLGETQKCQDCYRKGLLAVTEVLNLEQHEPLV